MILFFILITTIPAMAEGNVYIDGVDAFREKSRNPFRGNDNLPYKDAQGNALTGTVIQTTSDSGTTYERHIKTVDGYADGLTITFKDGAKVMENTMSKGERHGQQTGYLPSGAVNYKGTFTNGKIDGISIWYNEDGSIKQQTWSENGVMLAGFRYENGKPVALDSTVKNICNEGEKTEERTQSYYTLGYDAFFDNGSQTYIDLKKKPVTGHITDAKAKTVTEMDAVNGLLEGVVKTFTEGRLVSEVYYMGGRKHGADITYHKSGLPELSVHYLYDRIEGLTTYRNEKGKIVHEVIFREGKAVSGYKINKDKLILMTKDDLKMMEENYL